MFYSLLPFYVLWFVVLLYGLTYLLAESELLERPRKWFTSTVFSPTDAAIEALLAEHQSPSPATVKVATSVLTPPVSTLDTTDVSELSPDAVNPLTSPGALRRFVGKVLSCWQCTAGWLANVAAGLVTLFAVALVYDWCWLAGILAFFMVPPTGIGFITLMEHLSPKRAMDSVTNVMTDVAHAVLNVVGNFVATSATANATTKPPEQAQSLPGPKA